jgi:hypothetical protein
MRALADRTARPSIASRPRPRTSVR